MDKNPNSIIVRWLSQAKLSVNEIPKLRDIGNKYGSQMSSSSNFCTELHVHDGNAIETAFYQDLRSKSGMSAKPNTTQPNNHKPQYYNDWDRP